MKSKMHILLSLIFFLLIGSSSFAQGVAEQQAPVVVIFGATGDLTARKLVPALYQLTSEESMSKETRVIGFARQELSDSLFRQQMKHAIEQSSKNKAFWQEFEDHISYQRGDFDADGGYEQLQQRLSQIEATHQRIYYLATHPKYFATIVKQLHKHHLSAGAKIIFEKPFGHDLESAIDLQKCISEHLDESQVYRMDHYLGKEGLQNILTLRFENAIFEPIWNHQYIDHVQITLAEEIGIGSRGRFWEETGSLRDIFQNHLMQLLTVVTMEPPANLSAKHIHEEKLKVLNAIRPLPLSNIVRGQYGTGSIHGISVPGYKQENNVSRDSSAETFVAAKLFIDNKRWEGVPFYIRGGKRLAKQMTEVAITFKKNPLSNFPANVLFIRIQPNAGISFRTLSKVPMLDHQIKAVTFGYASDSYFKTTSPEAYEKLIYDCVKGHRHLFVDAEEQIAAWRLFMPVLDHWKLHPDEALFIYEVGSWGPSAVEQMLLENGHEWQFLEN